VQDGHPNSLSREIATRVQRSGDRVAVIGVRQVLTLQGLGHLCPAGLSLVYVDTQPTTCAARFAVREGRPATDYFQILLNPVEADQQNLRRLADVLVDNEGTLEGLPDRLERALRKVGF
jgi:dephospho-CoA kinase